MENEEEIKSEFLEPTLPYISTKLVEGWSEEYLLELVYEYLHAVAIQEEAPEKVRYLHHLTHALFIIPTYHLRNWKIKGVARRITSVFAKMSSKRKNIYLKSVHWNYPNLIIEDLLPLMEDWEEYILTGKQR